MQSTQTHEPQEPLYAICIMNPDGGSNVRGIVKLVQTNGKVKITAEIENLPAGKHGFHVHEFGNLLKGCTTAGAHFNPEKKNHGAPTDTERHIGDLGNIESTGSGTAKLEIEDHLIKLNGPYSVIGRAFVVHTGEDDLGRGGHSDSLTTGNAGARLACGVIGISGPL